MSGTIATPDDSPSPSPPISVGDEPSTTSLENALSGGSLPSINNNSSVHGRALPLYGSAPQRMPPSPFAGRPGGRWVGAAREGTGGGGKGHSRSASHVGILRTASDAPAIRDQGSVALFGKPISPTVKGHQRALSHGHMNEGKGHKREGSRTDFILPEGHELRERQREMRPAKSSLKRSSLQRKGHSRQASRTESVYTIRDQKQSLLRRLFFWKKNTNESCSRFVVPNHIVSSDVTSSAHPNKGYPSNRICTTKYTLLSFLPKNLFEQFHRFANLYFLFIVLLNFVPSVNAFAKELAVLPLVFVLGVTAVKDAYEDQRRFKSDRRVNNKTCRVYSSLQGRYIKTTWAELKVGDIVHLSCDEAIPADIVLLSTADDHGVAYIESSNLDGETSLKQRQSVKGIGMDEGFEVSKFDSVLEVGPPTTKIYHFVGSITIGRNESLPLSKDNLILRDCVIKNTDYVEGIVVYAGRETKALLNNGGTRYKWSKLERQMNREVVWCVVILIIISIFSCTGSALWLDSYTDSFHRTIPFLPLSAIKDTLKAGVSDQSFLWVAFISFWTFIILYQVLIPISLYVTIEIIKVAQVFHIHHDPHFRYGKDDATITCRALNITEELGQVEYVFTDKTGTLTENQMVFQRCSINAVDYDHSPLLLRDSQENTSETFILNPLLQDELNSLELQYIYNPPGSRQSSRNVAPRCKDSQRVLDFFFTMAACNTVIVAKHPRRDQMNASGMIITTDNSGNEDERGSAFNSPRHLPLKNPLFRSLFPSPRSLSPIASSPSSTPPPTPDASPRDKPPLHFCLSKLVPFSNVKSTASVNPEITLNTFETLPENETSGNSNQRHPRPNHLQIDGSPTHSFQPSRSPSPGAPLDTLKPIYEAESPDELALVDAAYKYGCRLLRRNLNSVVVSLPGSGATEFEILNVLPFDSNRKRMSIIVRHPDTGEKILYTKGADSTILQNLSRRQDEASQIRILQTQKQLNNYANKGLRVLCMAKKVLSDTEYEEWALTHKQAEMSLANRDQKLLQSYNRIETNLHLTGATGIEDRLQEGVPETVKALRKAGINVWVLTGDKQETAINIAYSCALFTPNMEILKLNARTKDQTERTILVYLQQIEEEERARRAGPVSENRTNSLRAQTKERGLVVDGKTLVFILDRRANLKDAFLRLVHHCNAVMCCRATPLQKALMVRTAKDHLKVLTLAVGDGANDVSMIQTADVGVGISGVEGRQAVMASDFAITRFRHLEKLLLVHGHWCYDRLSRVILYFFYKNASFVFLLMWFQLYCGFSTSVMIDDLYLVMFSLLFTSLPPITVGVYDQDAPEELLLSQPRLYAKTRLGTVYTSKAFWVNIVDAVYQSLVIFFSCVAAYSQSDAGIYEFGMTINHALVVIQLLHISIETKSWTIIHVGGILLSYAAYFLFGYLYTVLCNGCLGLPSQYGELVHMVSTPKHWFCVLLSTVVALTPRFAFRSLQGSLWPDLVTRALQERRAVNQGFFIEKISRASSSSSVFRSCTLDESCIAGEDPGDVMSSLVTMTTIISGNGESEA